MNRGNLKLLYVFIVETGQKITSGLAEPWPKSGFWPAYADVFGISQSRREPHSASCKAACNRPERIVPAPENNMKRNKYSAVTGYLAGSVYAFTGLVKIQIQRARPNWIRWKYRPFAATQPARVVSQLHNPWREANQGRRQRHG